MKIERNDVKIVSHSPQVDQKKSNAKNSIEPSTKLDIDTKLHGFLSSAKLWQKMQKTIAEQGEELVSLLPHKSIERKPTAELDMTGLSPKEEQIQRPNLIFVSGAAVAAIGGFAGIDELAKEYSEAQHFSWTEEKDIIGHINSHTLDQPLILVGHGLGGDKIVEIARMLEESSPEREIDLLVTMDSTGFDNDIIPKNVKKNLNFIGRQDALFNDAPNMADDNEKTNVENIVVENVDHEEIAQSFAVKRELKSEVDRILKDHQQLVTLLTISKFPTKKNEILMRLSGEIKPK